MSSPLPPHFSSETLDYFLPGYTFFSRAISSVLHIDITPYIPFFLTAGLAYTAGNYICNSIHDFVWDRFTSTAVVYSGEVHASLSYWLSRQPSTSNTRQFMASSRNEQFSYMNGIDGDSGSDNEDDTDERTEFDPDASENFEEYLSHMDRRAKLRRLIYTPAASHCFRHNNRTFRVKRQREKADYGWQERMELSCLGWGPQPVKDVLEEARRLFLEREKDRTVIFQPMPCPNPRWTRSLARHPRPLSTVVLDKALKDKFMNDVKDYLHPLTRRWYVNRGIPYRRGYLFSGPPGCGKTSLCYAAAGALGLKIYFLGLNSRQLSEESLAQLFSSLPQKCIVLLEDVDTAGITHTRAKVQSITPADENEDDSSHNGEYEDKPNNPSNDSQGARGGISLSALLNTIDGIASTEGRILIMTTNHVENLDPALLRPGRVDMVIDFEYANTQPIKDLFRAIYTEMESDEFPSPSKRGRNKKTHLPITASPPATKIYRTRRHNCSSEEIARLADDFAAIVPAGKFSPADIQGYLLKHKDKPREAVDNAQSWAEEKKANVKQNFSSSLHTK